MAKSKRKTSAPATAMYEISFAETAKAAGISTDQFFQIGFAFLRRRRHANRNVVLFFDDLMQIGLPFVVPHTTALAVRKLIDDPEHFEDHLAEFSPRWQSLIRDVIEVVPDHLPDCDNATASDFIIAAFVADEAASICEALNWPMALLPAAIDDCVDSDLEQDTGSRRAKAKIYSKVANKLEKTLLCLDRPEVSGLFSSSAISEIGDVNGAPLMFEQLVAGIRELARTSRSCAETDKTKFRRWTRWKGKGSAREIAVWVLLAPAFEQIFGRPAGRSRSTDVLSKGKIRVGTARPNRPWRLSNYN
jgi:hypothetical protein